jgi:large-conductance mechanosensitive channel
MFSFLVDEGVITIGTISGIFTTGMLMSFKNNIVEPTIENLIPSHTLDKSQFGEDTSLDNIMKIHAQVTGKDPATAKVIKWQTFLKDFVTWLALMYFLYLAWKNLVKKKE